MNKDLLYTIIRIMPFLIVLVIIYIFSKRNEKFRQDLVIQKPSVINHYLLWISIFLAFIIVVELTLYQAGLLKLGGWHHSLSSTILRIVGIVILAPIAEELMFRGFLLSRLTQKKINLHLSIVIQAVIFVLLHNFTYQNDLMSNIGIAQSFIDATLYGYARYHTKSIFTPISMHMTGNAIALIERFIG